MFFGIDLQSNNWILWWAISKYHLFSPLMDIFSLIFPKTPAHNQVFWHYSICPYTGFHVTSIWLPRWSDPSVCCFVAPQIHSVQKPEMHFVAAVCWWKTQVINWIQLRTQRNWPKYCSFENFSWKWQIYIYTKMLENRHFWSPSPVKSLRHNEEVDY